MGAEDIPATNVVIPEFETVFGVAINAITGMPALIGGPLGFVLVLSLVEINA